MLADSQSFHIDQTDVLGLCSLYNRFNQQRERKGGIEHTEYHEQNW